MCITHFCQCAVHIFAKIKMWISERILRKQGNKAAIRKNRSRKNWEFTSPTSATGKTTFRVRNTKNLSNLQRCTKRRSKNFWALPISFGFNKTKKKKK